MKKMINIADRLNNETHAIVNLGGEQLTVNIDAASISALLDKLQNEPSNVAGCLSVITDSYTAESLCRRYNYKDISLIIKAVISVATDSELEEEDAGAEAPAPFSTV